MVVLCEFHGGFMVVLSGSMVVSSCDLPSTEQPHRRQMEAWELCEWIVAKWGNGDQ